jgi:hypothetical protein
VVSFVIGWAESRPAWTLYERSDAETGIAVLVAVGMLNRGEQPLPVFIDWKSLGLTGKAIRARDLWAHSS